jgi:hypothetical protein
VAFLTLLAFVTDVGASIHSASGNGRTLGKSSTLRLPRAELPRAGPAPWRRACRRPPFRCRPRELWDIPSSQGC